MSESVAETRPADEGTSTPAVTEGTPAVTEDAATPISRDEDPKSRRVSLADLSAKGTALYAHKQYEDAAEIFSRASVLQAELNGETAPENAEILFHYGRSLFKVGQSKSDVLGGSAAPDRQNAATAAGSSRPAAPAETGAQKVTRECVADTAGAGAQAVDAPEDKDGDRAKEGAPDEKKPLFQFTGDENFDDSSDEEPQEEAPEEEDDDLATAFEILDLARVCYQKQLEQLEKDDEAGKGKEAAQDSPSVRHIKERLADTHDCLAEISLENERYPNAIEDGRTSLNYKLQLYPEDSEIIAEAHYKLSLALEFASVTTADDEGKNAKREAMDQGLRDEAIEEMGLAIKSFKLKMQNKEVEVAVMASPEDNDLARKAIVEMKEVLADMEQRACQSFPPRRACLVDLKKDPIDASDLLGGPQANALGGLFGAALGETAAETRARVEEAKKTAIDLTGLVRKKKVKQGEEPEPEPAAPATNGKRKAEEASETAESPKKAKVENEPDEVKE
ncbi:histone H1-binding protein [Metarhizium album ARSEF 1941]|uniref:Histone H1-binding protein n=1 Tax=Metarhizium album (strain ARSEF 1941) TaxID=1081103 RepID=A0A0B2WT49_METAS|nr:histone H1-binding protein [Metarhizium album ARSEF 1941]KHN96145.1 histone H1-binding protein [Metarhizium album ARSEF 1941]